MSRAPEVVVADTSPLQYLHLLGLLDVLEGLYGTVLVPAAVVDELAAGRAQGLDLPHPERLPWMEVRACDNPLLLAVSGLGRGEREALALAHAASDGLLLVDDRRARLCAKRIGLRHTGTAGVLVRAKHEGIVEHVGPHIDRLTASGFRCSARTIEAVLRLAGEPALRK